MNSEKPRFSCVDSWMRIFFLGWWFFRVGGNHSNDIRKVNASRRIENDGKKEMMIARPSNCNDLLLLPTQLMCVTAKRIKYRVFFFNCNSPTPSLPPFVTPPHTIIIPPSPPRHHARHVDVGPLCVGSKIAAGGKWSVAYDQATWTGMELLTEKSP